MLSFEKIRDRLIDKGVPREKAETAARLATATTMPASAPVNVPRARKAVHKGLDLEQRKFRVWCRDNGLPLPVCEHPLPKPDGYVRKRRTSWRFDYAWPDADGPGGVALEVQGGVWRRGGGAHTGTGHIRDMEKISYAQTQGWIVLQVVPERMFTPGFLELIQQALATRFGDQSPGTTGTS